MKFHSTYQLHNTSTLKQTIETYIMHTFKNNGYSITATWPLTVRCMSHTETHMLCCGSCG